MPGRLIPPGLRQHISQSLAAAGLQWLEQGLAQPVECDPDIGVPVDRERLPRLLLQRGDRGVGAGDQHDGVRPVAVGETGGDVRIGGIGDLGPDVRLVPARSLSAAAVRATATTGVAAWANAEAIPRPRPRLAPTTTVTGRFVRRTREAPAPGRRRAPRHACGSRVDRAGVTAGHQRARRPDRPHRHRHDPRLRDPEGKA